MKLTLLYGTDQVAIANTLLRIRSDHPSAEVIELEGAKISTPELKAALGTQGLFGSDRLVLVHKPSEELNLTGLEFGETSLVFISEKELKADSALVLSTKPLHPQVINCNIIQAVTAFPFLDLLFQKNPKVYIELEKLLAEFGTQYVLTMIGYGLRRLILPSKSSSDFMHKKLDTQKRIFPEEVRAYYYRELLETDFEIKQGEITEKTALVSLIEKFLMGFPRATS